MFNFFDKTVTTSSPLASLQHDTTLENLWNMEKFLVPLE
jgi:hypothetical protein